MRAHRRRRGAPMAEDGIDDFALAKRKAARQLGVARVAVAAGERRDRGRAARVPRPLPGRGAPAARCRSCARSRWRPCARSSDFNPYLTGPVLKGTAGPYAEIELQLFPRQRQGSRDLPARPEHRVHHATRAGATGDRAHAVSVLLLAWRAPLRLSIFDPRDERVALKTSQAGRVTDRAGIAEVGALLRRWRRRRAVIFRDPRRREASTATVPAGSREALPCPAGAARRCSRVCLVGESVSRLWQGRPRNFVRMEGPRPLLFLLGKLVCTLPRRSPPLLVR